MIIFLFYLIFRYVKKINNIKNFYYYFVKIQNLQKNYLIILKFLNYIKLNFLLL